MSPDSDLFSSEYVSDSGTSLPSTQKPPQAEGKGETEASPKKYGVSKPKRRIIRGQIINDQS